MIGYSRRLKLDEYNQNEPPTVCKQGDDSKYGKRELINCGVSPGRPDTYQIILASKDDLIFDL